MAVVSHNNQRIRPRPLDPAELLGGVLTDHHDVVVNHHQDRGPKRSSSEVLTKTAGYDQHSHSELKFQKKSIFKSTKSTFFIAIYPLSLGE